MVSWLVFFTSQHHPPEYGFIANMFLLICEPCMDHQNATIHQNAQETGIEIISTLQITTLQQENSKYYYYSQDDHPRNAGNFLMEDSLATMADPNNNFRPNTRANKTRMVQSPPSVTTQCYSMIAAQLALIWPHDNKNTTGSAEHTNATMADASYKYLPNIWTNKTQGRTQSPPTTTTPHCVRKAVQLGTKWLCQNNNATTAAVAEATKGANMDKHTYRKQSNGPRASASTTGNVVEGNGASAGHSHIITDNKKNGYAKTMILPMLRQLKQMKGLTWPNTPSGNRAMAPGPVHQ